MSHVEAEPEEAALWRALRFAVVSNPSLGVDGIGPKPQSVEDEIRVTIDGRQFNVYIEHASGE